MAVNSFVCVEDFEKHAEKVMKKADYDFVAGGANEELTLRRNREAFSRLIIRPRMLRGVSNVDLRVKLLEGRFNFPSPILIGSVGTAQVLAHDLGELATAKAAKSLNTVMGVSTSSHYTLEEIAGAAPGGLRWFQLYIEKDRAKTIELIRRAEAAQYSALVLTIDGQTIGKRIRDLRNSFILPANAKYGHFPHLSKNKTETPKSGESGHSGFFKNILDDSITWDVIPWLKRVTKLPILVKGVLCAEDAILAWENGVDGVVVSNHGGRQLDSTPATIEVLPSIAKALKGKCDIIFDGGLRTGNDIFKALALGAKAVFIGRPIIWGLAHSGQAGIESVMHILEDELKLSMSLAGCRNVAEIQDTDGLVVHEDYYRKFSKL